MQYSLLISSSLPTARYFRLNGFGCPFSALTFPQIVVCGSPFANSIKSKISLDVAFPLFTMNPACFSDTHASPILYPLRLHLSIRVTFLLFSQ